MAGAQQNLTVMTLNLGGVVKKEDEFNKMLDRVDIALLQEFHHELPTSSHFHKLDCYTEGGPKTNLSILISRNFFNNFDSPDQFYFDGIEHKKTNNEEQETRNNEEQETTNNEEQETTNNEEQETTNNEEQETTNNEEQETTNNEEQETTNKEEQETNKKEQKTFVQYSYMYCCLRLEKTSYFIVNLHIKKESYATIDNLRLLQHDLKAKSQEFFKGDTTCCWIIGGDFNFINRFEDGLAKGAVSSLRWWRHYFIDTLPAKDIYPRSSRKKVKHTHGKRRIDRLYVDKRLINCIASVRTGNEELKDHRPVYCEISPMDGSEEAKKCNCCGSERGEVRCSTCCLWVCGKCVFGKKIPSKRCEKIHEMTRSTIIADWAFSHAGPDKLSRDGAIDGSAEVTDYPKIKQKPKNAVRLCDTKLYIYICKSCDKGRKAADREQFKRLHRTLTGEDYEDLKKKCEDLEKKCEDLEKKCEDLEKENEDLKKKMISADPEE